MIDSRLDQFLQKGPVDIPSVQYKIWSPKNIEYVKQFLTEDEWFYLSIAESHSVLVGEGRGEWDDIVVKIRERLEIVEANKHKLLKKRKLHRESNIEQSRAQQKLYSQTPEGKRSALIGSRKWAKKNPEKRRAHEKVKDALRSGKLSREPCRDCSTTEDLMAHHHDYSLPLDIIWLCRTCHRDEHNGTS